MTPQNLKVYFYPDVTPIERAPFEAIISALREKIEVSVVEVNDNHVGVLKRVRDTQVWIIARRWRKAFHFLGGNKFSRGNMFISVLDLDSPRQTIYHVLAKKVFGSLPRNCTLLVHSPINYRFFGEMERLGENQLRFLPLPVVAALHPKRVKGTDEPFTIGTFTPFSSEAQLNFIASVAHYLLLKNSTIYFRVLGYGPLYRHMIELGTELELGNRFSVTEAFDEGPISELDAFIYCPLRNDHFIPLYVSGQYALPTVATEMAGIDEFIQDGKTGFMVGVNETKAMAELLLRIASSTAVTQQMGKKFQEQLFSQYSLRSVFSTFLETLTGQRTQPGAMERAA